MELISLKAVIAAVWASALLIARLRMNRPTPVTVLPQG